MALEKDEYEQRKMKNIKLYSNYGNKTSCDMIDTFSFGNLNEELEYVIQFLEENMMNIYVENLTDYSIKDAPSVVRVVIPTLENWYDTRDRLGSRLYERDLVRVIIMRKNKIMLLMLLFFGLNFVLIKNVDASTSKNTYTIVYNSNGGNGKQVTQKCKRNKYVNLIGNTYKKEGYVFSGWTVNKNGSGKMYKNKARVKNLTSGNKIILYAK